MPADQWTIDRTDQKFRYARIHLDELLNYEHRGANNDWEHAHEEACMYHLVGAIEGTFQEMNTVFGLGLSIDKAKLSLLEKAAKANLGLTVSLKLYQTERALDPGWLSLLYELRNWGAHRRYTGRQVSFGTVSNQFVHPVTRVLVPGGTTDVLADFEIKAKDLVARIRATYP